MKTRKSYKTPEVEHILIDNEISLALQSYPLDGPFESLNESNTESDPYKLT